LPVTKSAEKEMRKTEKRRLRNKALRTRAKTMIDKAERFIFSGDIESARKTAAAAIQSLDKAAEKGILHPNNAARRKARLMKKLNQARTPPAPKEPTPTS
jgi:small subunit ribosomal protein S20